MISQFSPLVQQRTVVESVCCLNEHSLSTIKTRIFVWYLTSHFFDLSDETFGLRNPVGEWALSRFSIRLF